MFMRKTPAFFGEANLSSKQPLSAERWSDRYYIPKLSKFGMVETMVLWCVMIFSVGRWGYVFRNSLEKCSCSATILISWNSIACKDTFLVLSHHNDSQMCGCQKKLYIDRDRYITSHQVAVLATSCPISFRCRVSKDKYRCSSKLLVSPNHSLFLDLFAP